LEDEMAKSMLAISVLLLFSFYVHKSFAEGPLPPLPECSDDCFSLSTSTLNYNNTSATYAKSIFRNVKEILYLYLAEGKMSQGYFNDANRIPNNKGILLDLLCNVERAGDTLLLSVILQNHITQENYLESTYEGDFFRPDKVLEEFSSTFVSRCKLKVENDDSYAMQNEVNRKIGLFKIDGIKYYDQGAMLGDFGYDLRMTQGLPESIMHDLDMFAVRKKVETITSFSFLALSVTSLLVHTIAFPYEPLFNSSNAGAGLVVTIGEISTVGMIAGMIAVLVDRPRKAISELNGWVSNR
jgi:hypothetical protein